MVGVLGRAVFLRVAAVLRGALISTAFARSRGMVVECRVRGMVAKSLVRRAASFTFPWWLVVASTWLFGAVMRGWWRKFTTRGGRLGLRRFPSWR